MFIYKCSSQAVIFTNIYIIIFTWNNHVSLLINSTFFISKCYYGNAFVIIFRIIVFAGDYFIA